MLPTPVVAVGDFPLAHSRIGKFVKLLLIPYAERLHYANSLDAVVHYLGCKFLLFIFALFRVRIFYYY